MMLNRSRELIGGQRGQSAVEFALVTPLMTWMILGILQLSLMQQAKLMLEYAAFSAARAGAVWNGDPSQMEKAAVFAILPTMPTWPVPGLPIGKPQRVDSLGQLMLVYLEHLAATKVADKVPGAGWHMIKVQTLNPIKSTFAGKKELDFDDVAFRKQTQLVIRVVYNYELRIPFANWIMWESWYASNGGITLTGLDPSRPNIKLGPGMEIQNTGLQARILLESNQNDNCVLSGVKKADLLISAGIALGMKRYFLPMSTTYTIRMQSNPFLSLAPKNAGCS